MKKELVISLLIILFFSSVVYGAGNEKGKVEFYGGIGWSFVELRDINDHLKAREDYLTNDLIGGSSSPVRGYFSPDNIDSFEEIKGGVSYWGQLNYWIKDDLAVGGRIERLGLESSYIAADEYRTYYDESYNFNLTGLLGMIIYSSPLFKEERARPVKFNLKLAAGRYLGNLNWSKELDFNGILEAGTESNERESYTGSTWGGKLGFGLIIPVKNGEVKFGSNYRLAVFKELTDEAGRAYYSIYEGDTSPERFEFSGWGTTISLNLKF